MSTPSPTRLSRRGFLGTLGATTAGLALGACAERRTRRPPRPFRFLVVNDLHHAAPECDPFFAQLVEQMRGHGDVAFCLIVGDLSDKGRPESLRSVRDAFARLGAPIHCVPGNHDCDVEQDTRLFDAEFPEQRNQRLDHEGWQFLGLDTTDGNKWGDTTIQPSTFAWLDAALPHLDRDRPTVLFTHFPLVPGLHPRLPLTPGNAGELLARFEGWNLRCAFTGHYHARTERAEGAATLLTNCCCARVRDNHDGSIPEGYLLCTAQPDGGLQREFVRFAPAERSAGSG